MLLVEFVTASLSLATRGLEISVLIKLWIMLIARSQIRRSIYLDLGIKVAFSSGFSIFCVHQTRPDTYLRWLIAFWHWCQNGNMGVWELPLEKNKVNEIHHQVQIFWTKTFESPMRDVITIMACITVIFFWGVLSFFPSCRISSWMNRTLIKKKVKKW